MHEYTKRRGLERTALSIGRQDPSAFSLQPERPTGCMKLLSRCVAIGMLLILGPGFFPARALAQSPLLDYMEIPKQYLVELSGTVMNETFTGAQALLTLMAPSPANTNPHQLIIEGFPKKNSRNSFFWNSNYSDMTAIENEITCEIKRTYVKQAPLYFIFLSPELLRHTGAAYEGAKLAERVALPTLINARAGKLKLRIHSNSVSGTVWMKGYDPVEKSFVQYSARLAGKRSFNLEPRQQIQKGTTAGE